MKKSEKEILVKQHNISQDILVSAIINMWYLSKTQLCEDPHQPVVPSVSH